MSTKILMLLGVAFSTIQVMKAQTITQLGLYRTFERSLVNNNTYANKFIDVELTCRFTSPSGKVTDFIGFFDGNGSGGGDKQTGNVWKIRFIPDEIGEWHYTWTWSDPTSGGGRHFQV